MPIVCVHAGHVSPDDYQSAKTTVQGQGVANVMHYINYLKVSNGRNEVKMWPWVLG